MKRTAEICTGSFEDCLQAFKAGARRVELNSALFLGGLTPSLSALDLAKKETNLEIICMVRPRAGGFQYSAAEFQQMLLEAKKVLEHGADGIAFGVLDEGMKIDKDRTIQLIDLAHRYGKAAVFHRAFDLTPDLYESASTLIELGADRILTSGGHTSAVNGVGVLQSLQKQFGDRIEILPGCGITPENAKWLLEQTGVHSLHASCSSLFDNPASGNELVSFEYRPEGIEKTDPEKAAAFIKSVESDE